MRRAVISALLGGALAASLALTPSMAVAADPPPNDDFANGQVILSKGESVNGSNVGATAEPGEPNHADAMWEGQPLQASHSIWWSWTPTSSGEAKIITCNSDFDTRLGVYTGDAVNALTPVASALDTNGGECNSVWAGVTFTATAGTTYRIAVDTEGDLAGNGSGPTWGTVALTLTAPPGDEEPPPPPPDDDTNPGTEVSEEPYTFKMPRIKLWCDEFRGEYTPDDCLSNKSKGLFFWHVQEFPRWPERIDSVSRWLASERERGADILLIPRPISANDLPRSIKEHLRGPKGRGGEVIYQSLTPGESFTTTSETPARLVVHYFEPAQDKKVLEAELARLEKLGEDRKNVKSPCDFIDTDASFDDIERRLSEALGSGSLTQQRAGAILKDYGCNYEVAEYVDGAGFTTDVVLDVVGVDKKRNVIQLKVALPLRQDFLFVISEEPVFSKTDNLGLGVDGRLTASSKQNNLFTVQVLERATGRLAPGVHLDFWDLNGKPVTEKTNEKGEWTFTSKMPFAGSYLLKGTYTAAGVKMVGFRQIDVVDRKASYVTMSGRSMTWSGGTYTGTQADIDRARAMAVVPASLGTGLTSAPTATPTIQQITAAAPTANGLVTGMHNGIAISDNTNFAVGSSSGLVVIGGGLPPQTGSAKPILARAWPNPFQAVANMLNTIVTGLQRTFAQGPDGEGTVAKKTTSADQAKVSTSASTLSANGASTPPSGLISDKGLGVISTGGGNIISDNGGGIASLQGLALRDAKGNLIGQAGGNLIGQAGGNLIGQAGGNVISVGGGNTMPVYGGNVISTGGLN